MRMSAETANTVLGLGWLIAVIPIVSAGFLITIGRRIAEPWGGVISVSAVAASFCLVAIETFALISLPAEARVVETVLYQWIPAGGFQVQAGILVDPLSVTWMALITGVGLLIHIYALGYMAGDNRHTAFFGYMNLFVGSMLILVLGNNFLVLFVGWELVGMCSYLLISFWFSEPANSSAGNKAFFTNRVGDFAFLIGLMLIFATVGSLQFDTVFGAAAASVGATGPIAVGIATAICILLLIGVAGKSAQIPLYVWLPDAMAGPTPVSALIHAATMVTAGVYLIARAHSLFELSSVAKALVAFVGIGTAFYAATIALGQYRLKRVLAYSTISQIGYMVAGVGVGGLGYTAGVFQVVSHGLFKAMLFLCAGSVMHSMGNEEDMRYLGGLRKHMPWTAGLFLVAALSMAGVFPFSGFWSKDAILGALFEAPEAWGKIAWAIGLVTALITALYIFRAFFLTFTGERHWDQKVKHPHESPWVMIMPIAILGAGTLALGIADLPDLPGLKFLHTWLEPTFGAAGGTEVGWTAQTAILLGVSLAVALVGIAIAYAVWFRTTKQSRIAAGRWIPAAIGRFWRNAYEVDEGLERGLRRPGWALTGAANTVDTKVIDRIAMGVGGRTKWIGRQAARLQTGYVRTYALVVLAGMLAIVGYMLARGGSGL